VAVKMLYSFPQQQEKIWKEIQVMASLQASCVVRFQFDIMRDNHFREDESVGCMC